MKKAVVFLSLFLTISLFPRTARSDMFGGDVAVLSQILINAIQQLAQLRSIVSSGQDSLALLQSINQGLNDSLGLIQTISPERNPGIYSDWQKADQALRAIQSLYGIAITSPNARIQQDADRSTAEAVSLNNSIYAYTSQIDDIGERIKSYSHFTSPGGAQKLTAEALGVMLHVMNQSLRAQATGLKLQAQVLAIQNHKDKNGTQRMLADSEALKSAMKAEPVTFAIPRF